MEPSVTTAVSPRRLWAVLCVLAVLILFMNLISPSVAQSEQRVLKADIPKHLPLKVKISEAQEQGFKKVDTERWLRDFELEVTNTGDKPIYYLYLLLRLPEAKISMGTTLVYPLRYGRSKLSDIEFKAEPEDIPIKPGETYSFRIHRGQVMVWEKSVRERKLPQPIIVELAFQKLSFGDRSGYGGPDGQKVPHPPYRKSAFGRCDDKPNKAAPKRFVGLGFESSDLNGAPQAAGPGMNFYKSRTEKTLLLVTGGGACGLGPGGTSIVLAAGTRERLFDSRFDIAFGLATNSSQL